MQRQATTTVTVREMGGYLQPLDPQGLKPSSKNPGRSLSKRTCAFLTCSFLSLALLHLLCCSPAGTQRAAIVSPLLNYINSTYSFVSSVPGEGRRNCNYAVGTWVPAPGHARRYNATECNAKESHDCLRNGRPDTGYLDWRWQPAGCPLPAFDADAFLSAVRGKHVAFIGDSMARNQAQSLICLLSAAFPYRLLYRDPSPRQFNNWRYAFPSHGVQVSFYWNPFLVRATGKAEDETVRDNHVHLDEPGDRWGADADTIDVAVLAAAHWLLNGAIYYNGSGMIGAHGHPEIKDTGVGYAWPLRMVYRTAVRRLMSSPAARPRTLVLATFSPSHFEGKPTNDTMACAKTEPYKEGEKEMEWMYREVRDIVYDEAAAARARISGDGAASKTRIEVLDVSKLASKRPDGHPGIYMNRRDPAANDGGAPGKVPYSDCLHFCLPGPVDTFNEILLQILRKGP